MPKLTEPRLTNDPNMLLLQASDVQRDLLAVERGTTGYDDAQVIAEAARRVIEALVDRLIATAAMPTFPANRVLKEGECPCRICGSGRGDHAHRDHEFTR